MPGLFSHHSPLVSVSGAVQRGSGAVPGWRKLQISDEGVSDLQYSEYRRQCGVHLCISLECGRGGACHIDITCFFYGGHILSSQKAQTGDRDQGLRSDQTRHAAGLEDHGDRYPVGCRERHVSVRKAGDPVDGLHDGDGGDRGAGDDQYYGEPERRVWRRRRYRADDGSRAVHRGGQERGSKVLYREADRYRMGWDPRVVSVRLCDHEAGHLACRHGDGGGSDVS